MEPQQVFSSYDVEATPAPSDFHYCPRCGEKFEGQEQSPEPRRCIVCGFTVYRNPLPGVVVLIEKDGTVLLCKRSSGSFQPGEWCLPGGFIEYHEDFLSAGIREVKEETGLDVEIVSILSVVSNSLAPKLHTLVVVLLGHVKGGQAKAGDDAVSVTWVPLSGPLPEMAFEADGHIIQRYSATRLAGAPVDPRFSRGAKH